MRYGRSKSHNYQSKRFELAAQVDDGENYEEVLQKLKAMVISELFPEEKEAVRDMEKMLEAKKVALGMSSAIR